MNYHVIAVSDDIAKQVRTTLKSPGYGHPAQISVATGYGPCRSCLKTFRKGEEERILFTYEPFAGLDAVPAPGPIFIHKDACERYSASGFPPELRALPLLFEGMGRGGWPVTRERILDENVEASIERLFAHPAVEYIHVRNAEAGCFMARIERDSTGADRLSDPNGSY